jgi:Mg2+/citrate symporter
MRVHRGQNCTFPKGKKENIMGTLVICLAVAALVALIVGAVSRNRISDINWDIQTLVSRAELDQESLDEQTRLYKSKNKWVVVGGLAMLVTILVLAAMLSIHIFCKH